MLIKKFIKFAVCWFFLVPILMIMLLDSFIWSVTKSYGLGLSKFLVNGLTFNLCYKEWETI